MSHEWVDGIFADRGRAELQNDVGCYNWTKQQINDWNNGQYEIIMQLINHHAQEMKQFMKGEQQ